MTSEANAKDQPGGEARLPTLPRPAGGHLATGRSLIPQPAAVSESEDGWGGPAEAGPRLKEGNAKADSPGPQSEEWNSEAGLSSEPSEEGYAKADQSLENVYAEANTEEGCTAHGNNALDPGVLRTALETRMAARRTDEITRGVCLVGPHRDDILCRLGDLPVRGYASHGESWSYALALRLASVDLLRQDGVEPVLILDDVFAELDEQRRARLVAAAQAAEQTLVTAAVRADLPANLLAKIFQVEPGQVRTAD